MDTDWLEETFNRSFDQCESIDNDNLMAMAELQAELEVGMGFQQDHANLVDELYKSLIDPFVGNHYKTQKLLLQSAAKATGITIRFGDPRAADGTPLNLRMAKGLMAVYCDMKGEVCLHNFWVAYGTLKDQAG